MGVPAADYYSWTTADVTIHRQRFVVCTKLGMFEHRTLDPATLLLAENLEIHPSDAVLNLNCGAGLVGTVAATRASDGRCVMADANLLAVEAAGRTARANGVARAEVHLSSGTSHLAPLPRVDVAAARVPKGRLP